MRLWLGIVDPDVRVPDLPGDLARLLLRTEEHEHTERDPWGGWNNAWSENAARVRDPAIDRWLAARRAELAELTPLEPLWPNGRTFAACLTHDVDLVSLHSTARQAVRYARAGFSPGTSARGDRIARLARPPVRFARSSSRIIRAPSLAMTLERGLNAEAARGAFASYFFTVPPWGRRSRYDSVYAPEDPCTFRGRRMRIADVMSALAAEGYDVGLHGSYSAAFEPGALAVERARLKRDGLEITTTRQHFLRWDIRVTPLLQEAAGLHADSSLGFNFEVGYRAGTSLPFRLYSLDADRPVDVTEVPLVVEDTALSGDAGLGLDALAARDVIAELVDTAVTLGTAITFLFHPDKFAQPEWLSLYEWTLDYTRERGGWHTSLALLHKWWRKREERILAGVLPPHVGAPV